ncbi:hypothetical protein [Bradyrhizobium sp. 195]|uniref:hypothetical protein n=1 Tax=Bradyrhizobium sp. 195 TaxID=2782662 RepID=UPI0020018B2F|nr:hypothetical protein [Bradyrhizobium sp. 195]
MPTPKQMEKMTAAVRRNMPVAPGLAPEDDLPPEYWQALLDDRRAETKPGHPAGTQRLCEIPHHILRVGCSRCGRLVEIQRVDATRLYGADAVWKEVGRRTLDNTCTQRTGRHEEDGCWPTFD